MPLAGLRDLSRFPTSTLLPNTSTEDASSAPLSLDLGLGSSTQTKKWCFIAEIINVWPSDEYHTDLEVQDATGTRLRVVVSAAIEGFPREKLAVGNVLLILGAVMTELRDGRLGVEVADVAKVKCVSGEQQRLLALTICQSLPIQIDQFMNLNRNVQHYNSVEDGKGLCNGCLRRKVSLHRCTTCRLFRYCSNTCQNEGYNKTYHKDICKILGDADVQALFRGNWEQLEIFQSFVLQGQKRVEGRKESHLSFVLRETGHFLKL